MAYQSRTRKRVNALRRAPDGSAFQTCESCGVSVAIALADMHQCESIKRLKQEKEKQHQIKEEQTFQDQPRSEFRFFMESFAKNWETENVIEMDRKGFETWKTMSSKERQQYKLQASKVNDAYYEKLLKESEDPMLSRVDEEADSAEVGKVDKNTGSYYYDDDDDDDDDDSYDSDNSGEW